MPTNRAPVILATIVLPAYGANPALTLRLSDREYVGPDGVPWDQALLAPSSVEAGGNVLMSHWQPADLDLVVMDKRLTGQAVGDKFSNYFKLYEFVGSRCHIQQTFVDVTSIGDYRTVIDGELAEVLELRPESVTFAVIQNRKFNRIIPPRVANKTEFPKIPTDFVGTPLPIAFGDIESGRRTITPPGGPSSDAANAGISRGHLPLLTIESETGQNLITPKYLASDKQMHTPAEQFYTYEAPLNRIASGQVVVPANPSGGPCTLQLDAARAFNVAILPIEKHADTSAAIDTYQEQFREDKEYDLNGYTQLDYDGVKRVLRLNLPDVAPLGKFVNSTIFVWFAKNLWTGTVGRYGIKNSAAATESLVNFATAASATYPSDTPIQVVSNLIGPTVCADWDDLKNCSIYIDVGAGGGGTSQFGRPINDDPSTNGILNEVGASTNLYQSVDEVSASDSDYLTSAPAHGGIHVADCSGLVDPGVSTGHKLRLRCRRSAGTNAAVVTLRLHKTGAEIARVTSTNQASFTTFEYTLSGAEADAITDYTDLWFHVDFPSTVSTDYEVAWYEFEVPPGASDSGQRIRVHRAVLLVNYVKAAQIERPGTTRDVKGRTRFSVTGRANQGGNNQGFYKHHNETSPDLVSFNIPVFSFGKGVKDDGSGTYTGSASALIEHPCDLAHWALRELGGLGAGDIVTAASTFGSFADARGVLSGYKVFGILSAKQNLEAFLEELGGEVLCWFFKRTTLVDNPWVAIPWELGTAANYPSTASPFTFDREAQDIEERTFQATRTRISQIKNVVEVNFDYDHRTGSYAEQVYISDTSSRGWSGSAFTRDQNTTAPNNRETLSSESIARHGRRPLTVSLKYVRDKATATSIRSRLFDWLIEPRVQVRFRTFMNAYDLERGHVIKIGSDWDSVLPYPKPGSDGSWAGKLFRVFQVRRLSERPTRYAVQAVEV